MVDSTFPQASAPLVDVETGMISRAWLLLLVMLFRRVGGLTFLTPSMSTDQKNAISPVAPGMQVFDTTLDKLCVYTSSGWQTVTSV